MTYAEAMARFGTDKPDLRLSLELVDCTEFFSDTDLPGVPGALRRRRRDARRGEPAPQAARRLAGVGQAARRQGAGLRAGRTRTASSAGRSPRTSPTRSGPASPRTSGADPGTASSSPPGRPSPSRALLGAARLEIGRALRPDRRVGLDASCGCVDAPLFEPAAEATAAGDVAVGSGAWTAVHHAFTSPKPESMDTFDTDPGPRAGLRLRHGLQRQRDRRRVDPYPPRGRPGARLRGHGLSARRRRRRSSASCSTRSRFGAPPHGGIAFGWDRICALLSRHRLDPRRDRLPQDRVAATTRSRRRPRRSRRPSARKPASTRSLQHQLHPPPDRFTHQRRAR